MNRLQNFANERKHVLVLTSTFPRWIDDVEPPFVLELCKRLVQYYQVTVIAPHAAGSKLDETIDKVRVRRYRYAPPSLEKLSYQGGIIANLKRSRWSYLLLPVFFAAQLFAVISILRRERIDLVHAHWLVPQGLVIAIATTILGKNAPPFICTSHGGDLLGLNGRFLSSIKNWVIHRSSRMTVVSSSMVARALRTNIRPENLRVMSMGVDTQRTFTCDPQTDRMDNQILFVGRLVEKKGVLYLIQAMKDVLLHKPGAKLNIIGEGPDRYMLEGLVEKLHIQHAVNFLGAIKNTDVPLHYRQATILVAPSIITSEGDQEGLGLVLVEALACGCTVIATDVPAMQDVVISSDGGIIVPQKSSAAISKAILQLMADSTLRLTMAQKGQAYVQCMYDWEAIAKRYASLFEEVISVSKSYEDHH
jgi:glycosyltransferase involved in cell wall biosynthesis